MARPLAAPSPDPRADALAELAAQRRLAAGSPAARAWRRFRKHRLAMLGSIMLVLLVLASVLAPLVERYDPYFVDLRQVSKPPSAEHWFGTDRTGRDIWSRTIHAGRISLAVGVVAVSIAALLGTLLGALAGFYSGRIDNVIMRCTDVIMTFPALIILLTIVAFVGPSIFNIMAVLGLLSWPVPCRLVRSQFLSLREQDFVLAARCLGAPARRLIFVHILPNALAPVLVYMSFGMAAAILTEAGLSFLGLGVQPPVSSWGNMLNAARVLDVLENAPWMWVPPGVMTVLSVLAINFIGDGLRDALDPRIRL